MRIIAIVGARPQFIKSAMLNIAVREKQLAGADIQLDLLHTGQHYDHQMSEVFFRNMNIPEPKWRLSRSGTAEEMADGITWILEREKPDYVLVFGNANTTYAGALAAEKAGIPLIYIEAGLRSYNNDSIEEYNRIETDKHATSNGELEERRLQRQDFLLGRHAAGCGAHVRTTLHHFLSTS